MLKYLEVVLVSRAAVKKNPKLEIYFLPVLEARGPKSRCWKVPGDSEGEST